MRAAILDFVCVTTSMLPTFVMSFHAESRWPFVYSMRTCTLTNSTARPGSNLSPRTRVLLRTVVRTRRLDNEVFRSFKFNLNTKVKISMLSDAGRMRWQW